MTHCPFCRTPARHVRAITSPTNGKRYTEHRCPACELQFFTPAQFDATIYEGEHVEGYAEYHVGRTCYPDWTRALVKALRQRKDIAQQHILEIGAGDGINGEALHHELGVKKKNYWAIEQDRKSCLICRKRGVRVIAELFSPALAKKIQMRFDIVIIMEVLEHQIELRRFLAAACSLLRKDGLLIISVPNKERFFRTLRETPGDIPPHHFFRFNAQFFNNAFGSNVVAVRSFAYPHLITSSKVMSGILLKSRSWWPLLLPCAFVLATLDAMKGCGLLVIIRTNDALQTQRR